MSACREIAAAFLARSKSTIGKAMQGVCRARLRLSRRYSSDRSSTSRMLKDQMGPRGLRWSAPVPATSSVERHNRNTLPQDAQKIRPARPQRVKARGVPSEVRRGSERCENEAGGLFQHSALASPEVLR